MPEPAPPFAATSGPVDSDSTTADGAGHPPADAPVAETSREDSPVARDEAVAAESKPGGAPVGPGSGPAPAGSGAGRAVAPPGMSTFGTGGPAATDWASARQPAAKTAGPGWSAGERAFDSGRGPRRVEVVRGRRSRRIVRRLDTWTVLKVSAVFYLCAWLILLVAVVLLWFIASASGSIHDIEKSVRTLFDYSSYRLHAGAVFAYTAAGGFLVAVIGTLVNTLVSMLYNLISDVTGGLQVIVLAEDERFPDV